MLTKEAAEAAYLKGAQQALKDAGLIKLSDSMPLSEQWEQIKHHPGAAAAGVVGGTVGGIGGWHLGGRVEKLLLEKALKAHLNPLLAGVLAGAGGGLTTAGGIFGGSQLGTAMAGHPELISPDMSTTGKLKRKLGIY